MGRDFRQLENNPTQNLMLSAVTSVGKWIGPLLSDFGLVIKIYIYI